MRGCLGIYVLINIIVAIVAWGYKLATDSYDDGAKESKEIVEKQFESIDDIEQFRLSYSKIGQKALQSHSVKNSEQQSAPSDMDVMSSYSGGTKIGTIRKGGNYTHYFSYIDDMLLVSYYGKIGYVDVQKSKINELRLHSYSNHSLYRLMHYEIFNLRFEKLSLYIAIILSILGVLISFCSIDDDATLIAMVLVLLLQTILISIFIVAVAKGYTDFKLFDSSWVWYNFVNASVLFFIFTTPIRLAKCVFAALTDDEDEFAIMKQPIGLSFSLPMLLIVISFFIGGKIWGLSPVEFVEAVRLNGMDFSGGNPILAISNIAATLYALIMVGFIFYIGCRFWDVPIAIFIGLVVVASSLAVFVAMFAMIAQIGIAIPSIIVMFMIFMGVTHPSFEEETHSVEIRDRFSGRTISNHRGFTNVDKLRNGIPDKPDRIV